MSKAAKKKTVPLKPKNYVPSPAEKLNFYAVVLSNQADRFTSETTEKAMEMSMQAIDKMYEAVCRRL